MSAEPDWAEWAQTFAGVLEFVTRDMAHAKTGTPPGLPQPTLTGDAVSGGTGWLQVAACPEVVGALQSLLWRRRCRSVSMMMCLTGSVGAPVASPGRPRPDSYSSSSTRVCG